MTSRQNSGMNGISSTQDFVTVTCWDYWMESQHLLRLLKTTTGSMEDLGACVPPEVVLTLDIRIVLKYIKQNPEKAHLPSAALVVAALKTAFPCSTSQALIQK